MQLKPLINPEDYTLKSAPPKPVLLLILDGFGYREDRNHNAIALADAPHWQSLWHTHPHALLACAGSVVGLPDDQMGNSEVGHLHLGAGRRLPQDFTRINDAIADGSFQLNDTLQGAMKHVAADGNRTLHLIGLLSPGGVHSHERHLYAAVRMAAACGVKRMAVHAILDGRDTPPRSAMESIRAMQDLLAELGTGSIVSVVGRYFAMDRDQRWERVESAWHLMAKGQGVHVAADPVAALHAAYARGESDEFVAATSICQDDGCPVAIGSEDSVIFMNFRSDRARELVRAVGDPGFSEFSRDGWLPPALVVTLTQYDETFDYPVAFAPMSLSMGLGETVAAHGRSQLRLAETEKYAHVTFFFNGGTETPWPGEERILVPSPRVATYDLQPEMSAPEVTAHLVKAIREQRHDLIVCNYANGDMVGHTGDEKAAVAAVQALDHALDAIMQALDEVHGVMLLTADHGNAEQMVDLLTGQPHTAHTMNPVPVVLYGEKRFTLRSGGSLVDVAPTILALMQIDVPEPMTGESLLV